MLNYNACNAYSRVRIISLDSLLFSFLFLYFFAHTMQLITDSFSPACMCSFSYSLSLSLTHSLSLSCYLLNKMDL